MRHLKQVSFSCGSGNAVAQVKQIAGCFRDLCDSYLLKPIDLSKLLSLMKSYGLIT